MQRLALLLLIAATARAQDATFNFYPTSGSVNGGDVIQIHAIQPSLTFSPASQVFFGGVASPKVTLIDSTNLTAITPPHAEGIVNVTVRMAGATADTAQQFGFQRARDLLLIPVAIDTNGASGSRWTTDIWAFNDSDETVNLHPEVCSFIGAVFPCGDPLLVPPHAAAQVPPKGFPEMYLLPPSDVRGRLHFSVRARNAASAADVGTEIPVVPVASYRDSRVVLMNVPVSDRFRSVLRVYDDEHGYGANSIGVVVYDALTGEKLLRRDTGLRPAPTDSPLRFSFSFFDLLSDPALRGHDSLRIEIEEPGAGLWAMLTLTENSTQRVAVLTSQ